MNPQTIQIVAKRNDAPAVMPGLLAHLSDLDDDYMIADPIPDVRGWTVTLPDRHRVGRVDDVVLDTAAMTAKYLEVKVDPEVLLGEKDRWVLVPVESVRLSADEARIVIDHLPAGGLADAPHNNRELPTNAQQRAILAYFDITTIGEPRG